VHKIVFEEATTIARDKDTQKKLKEESDSKKEKIYKKTSIVHTSFKKVHKEDIIILVFKK